MAVPPPLTRPRHPMPAAVREALDMLPVQLDVTRLTIAVVGRGAAAARKLKFCENAGQLPPVGSAFRLQLDCPPEVLASHIQLACRFGNRSHHAQPVGIKTIINERFHPGIRDIREFARRNCGP